MARGKRLKQTKEQKDEDFVSAVEQMLGFPLMGWQKEVLIELRGATMRGEQILLCTCPPGSFGRSMAMHKSSCPVRKREDGDAAT